MACEYLSAAAISALILFMPAMLRGVYCIFDCPPHSTTSPKSTSLSMCELPLGPKNEMVVGVNDAGCGARRCRHVPLTSTFVR